MPAPAVSQNRLQNVVDVRQDRLLVPEASALSVITHDDLKRHLHIDLVLWWTFLQLVVKLSRSAFENRLGILIEPFIHLLPNLPPKVEILPVERTTLGRR
jgi:hypothetical protein